MSLAKQHNGRLAEELAQDYLQRHHLKLIAKNYRCPYGEIDLIMLEVSTLVFIEVRSRKNYNFGHPIESINSVKQSKIIKTAVHFTKNNLTHANRALRFDAVTMKRIDCAAKNMPEENRKQFIKHCDLTWYKNIISL